VDREKIIKRKNATKRRTAIEEIFYKTSHINMQINAKLDEINHWRHLATKAQTIFNAVNTGSASGYNRSKIEDCVCKITEIEESLKEDMEKLIQLKERAGSIIEKIDVPEYKSLLIHRYVCGKTWYEVADSLGYSYVHTVNRLHPRALKKICEMENENN